jgi:hypothetical protein
MPSKEEKLQFYKEIEKIVLSTKGELNWIEAVMHYCQNTGMEVEVLLLSLMTNSRRKSKKLLSRKIT